jgi:hypothetical protein
MVICIIWLFAAIIIIVKNRSINSNFIAGFLFLCIGYALVELRLFYTLIFLRVAPSWNGFVIEPVEAMGGLERYFISFMEYWTAGYYYAASMQKKLIFPFGFLVTIFLIIKINAPLKNMDGALADKVKEFYKNMDRETKILFLLELAIFCFSLIAALCGPVTGWAWIINRVLWYMVFALCIHIVIWEMKKLTFVFSGGDSCRSLALPEFVFFLIMSFLVLLQAGYTVSKKVYYSDARNTWAHMLHVALNIDDSEADYVSYGEYFAEYFFDRIKQDISYTGEKVAVLGYSSSVLVYNGFDCIAAYNSAGPTRNKYMEPVTLGPGVFTDRFNYILSKAEIVNSGDVRLNLVKKYEDDKGIYIIYLYKSTPGL